MRGRYSVGPPTTLAQGFPSFFKRAAARSSSFRHGRAHAVAAIEGAAEVVEEAGLRLGQARALTIGITRARAAIRIDRALRAGAGAGIHAGAVSRAMERAAILIRRARPMVHARPRSAGEIRIAVAAETVDVDAAGVAIGARLDSAEAIDVALAGAALGVGFARGRVSRARGTAGAACARGAARSRAAGASAAGVPARSGEQCDDERESTTDGGIASRHVGGFCRRNARG